MKLSRNEICGARNRFAVWLVAILFAVLSSAALRAAETRAYRFTWPPLCIDWNDETPASPAIRPKTCFVGKDDELVDLTKWFRKRKIPLKDGWVVWNETRNLLVVRGNLHEQLTTSACAGFYDQPTAVRILLEWYFGPEAWPVPGADLHADADAAMICRSAQRARSEVEIQRDGRIWSCRCEVEPVVSDTWVFFDVELHAAWSTQTGRSWEAKIPLTAKFGDRIPVAGFRTGGGGPSWLLAMTGERVLPDGTLWREATLRESPKGPVPVRVPELGENRVVDLDGGWKLGIRRMPPEKLAARFRAGSSTDVVDPFDPFTDYGLPEVEILPEIKIPPRLSKWLSGTGVDMRKNFERAKIPLNSDDIAIYDPSANWVMVCTKDAAILLRIDEMSGLGNCAPIARFRTEFQLEEIKGNSPSELFRCFLATRSGPEASISRNANHPESGSPPLFRWSVSGMQGDRENEIRLDSDIRVAPGAGIVLWNEHASYNLMERKPHAETEPAAGKGGHSFRKTIRAEFVPVYGRIRIPKSLAVEITGFCDRL